MNPIHLLSIEWQRFSTNSLFRLLAIFYVGLFALVVYVSRLLGNSLTMTPLDYLFVQPTLWTFTAYIGSWLNFSLLTLAGVFLITTDWTNRTLRQAVIFGASRGEVAIGKITAAVAIAAAATGVYVVMTAVAGWLLGGDDDAALRLTEVFSGVSIAGLVFLQAFGCLLFGLVVGVVIRQPAAATLVVLAYFFVIEAVMRWLFVLGVFRTRAALFLPDHLMESLTKLPLPEMVEKIGKFQQILMPLSLTESLIGSVAWIVAAMVFFFWRLQRADL